MVKATSWNFELFCRNAKLPLNFRKPANSSLLRSKNQRDDIEP